MTQKKKSQKRIGNTSLDTVVEERHRPCTFYETFFVFFDRTVLSPLRWQITVIKTSFHLVRIHTTSLVKQAIRRKKREKQQAAELFFFVLALLCAKDAIIPQHRIRIVFAWETPKITSPRFLFTGNYVKDNGVRTRDVWFFFVQQF